MALLVAQRQVELREVLLKDKPAAMLAASAKGTVPVLVNGDQVIDESLDVMRWALLESACDEWNAASLEHELVDNNDHEFKYWLDRYKYSDRYPELTQQEYLANTETFLARLEKSLKSSDLFLNGEKPEAIDLAIFPFVRQLAHVDLPGFKALPYPKLQAWLSYWLESDLFAAAMPKYSVWKEGDEGVQFAATTLTNTI